MSNTSIAMIATIVVILIFQTNSIETIEEKKCNTNLRKLGFDFNVEKTFNIKTISFLDQKLSYKYRVAVKNGKAINELIIDSNLGSIKFGNFGVDTETISHWTGKRKIFTLKTNSAIIGVYAKGILKWTINYLDDSKNKLQMNLVGNLDAIAEVESGYHSSYAGASGMLISMGGYVTISKSGISKDKGFNFHGTKVKAYFDRKIVVISEQWEYP